MQIIVLHSGLRQARTVTLGPGHVAAALGGTSAALLIGVVLLYYATFRIAVALDVPVVREVVQSATADATYRRERQFRDQIVAMASKLGEMQAQITRLDALGERVSGLMGIKPQEFGFGQPPGRGGAPSVAQRDLSADEFRAELDRSARELEERNLALTRFETVLLDRSVARTFAPSNRPIAVGYVGSGFGWRIDPFTGRQARHEGLDFAAPPGTPIQAAAGGVVVAAQAHPDFGQMVDIDHGNGLITRYAHASTLYVHAGDIVKRGDRIAAVGSTGRSTGPHLHFEVHMKGVAQNPLKFLSGQSLQHDVVALN